MYSCWTVLGASIVINLLVKGSLKSLGILVLELQELGIDPQLAAWIPAIAYTAFAILSSPMAWFRDVTSSRLLSLLGGLLVSLAFALACMPSLPLLLAGLGVLLGTGGCMATISGALEINRRFASEHLGMAHGLSLAGNCVGGLLVPPLVAWLVYSWGYRGAVVIHSALLLNILPASLLFSSSSASKKKPIDDCKILSTVPGDQTDQPSIFLNTKFWCFTWGMATTAIGYTNYGLYLPLHLNSTLGLNSQEAAVYLSIFSTGDFVGRVCGPFLSDKYGKRWVWYSASLVLTGTVIMILALHVEMVLAGVCTLLAGCGSGVFVGIFPALLSDELGAEQLSHTYPVTLTLAGVLNLAGPPLLAQISSTVSSHAVMGVLGSSLIIGALPTILCHLFQ